MATVFLGLRCGPLEFERIVALKRAFPRTDGLDTERLLAHEAQLAARVHHPNVVFVIDVDRVDGELLLVMEYVEGASLSRLMDGGPVAPRLLARILLDACAGLGAIHATCGDHGRPLGMVHRDVSPQNVLVGVDGSARLADFGLATVRASPRSTRPGTRRGKPGYMAPEYVRHGIATPSTDVFSLAVVAWEALTGRSLYGAADTLEQIEESHLRLVPPPSAFVAGISPAWDATLLRALGRTEAPRFADARALEDALVDASRGNVATRAEVASAVEEVARQTLSLRREIVRARLRESESSLDEEPSGVRERPTLPAVPRAKQVVPSTRTTRKLAGTSRSSA